MVLKHVTFNFLSFKNFKAIPKAYDHNDRPFEAPDGAIAVPNALEFLRYTVVSIVGKPRESHTLIASILSIIKLILN